MNYVKKFEQFGSELDALVNKPPAKWKPTEWVPPANAITHASLTKKPHYDDMKVGDVKLSGEQVADLVDEAYGMSEEEAYAYLRVLDDYFNYGGIIQRVVYAKRVNRKKLGDYWTHIGNSPENYLAGLYEFLEEEGLVKSGDIPWLITARTPPANIAIEASIGGAAAEQQLMILDTIILTDIKIVPYSGRNH